MKLHNRILFHCLCCGRVVHAEPDDKAPNCCGKRMTNAAAETIVEVDQGAPQNVAAPAGSEAPRVKNRPSPR
jgi:hypothetical protein